VCVVFETFSPLLGELWVAHGKHLLFEMLPLSIYLGACGMWQITDALVYEVYNFFPFLVFIAGIAIKNADI
jgi:hypothetical protein